MTQNGNSILGEAAWQQMTEWNSQPPDRQERCIHDEIHTTATRQSEAVAISAFDGTLSYAELDRLTARVARWLLAQGVEPGTHVPLCHEKSMWAVVYILAILRAGAAFVPLDPEAPTARHRAILAVLDAHFIITSATTKHLFENVEQVVALSISTDYAEQLLQAGATTTPPETPQVKPSDVAFVMFTSGSTGQPSGVPIEHGAMVTAAASYGAELGFGPATRTMQFSAFVWLPWTVEIIAPLIWGGTVCVPCDDERLNDTAGFIRRQHVNTAALTPSFLSAIEPSDVPTLQTLVVGGEKPSEELVARWASRVKLVLVYGSTETNLVLQTVQHAGSSDVTLKPVGCRAWITAPGDTNCPLSVGTPGELAIESWTIARGYLGGDNAARMAAKFVQTPQWLRHIRQRAETRLFMTGDMAIMLPDGRVRVLGRRDDVTKLRGQKVDLGEVDAAIRRSLPPRCRSAVLPSDDGEHLLGFVALNEESGSTQNALPEAHLIRSSVADDLITIIERDLTATLPAFLIPSRILVMDRFPLTASGKLDRQALLRLIRDAPIGAAGAKRKPRSAQEVTMCQLWSAVLKLSEHQIGLDDDFFQLGGHSLAAIRLVSQARKRDISLQVKLIFEHSTLEALSAKALPMCTTTLPATEPMELVSTAGSTNSLAELLDEISSQYSIQKEDIEDIYTCSPLQSGIMALTMKQPGAYAARCILPLGTVVDEGRLMEAWCTVHQQCPILRTRVVETNLGTLQVVLRDQLEWNRVETDLETFLQGDRKLHMTLGSRLSRLTVVHDTVKGTQLVWTVHHAIMDAWAIKALLSLVSDLYSGIQPEPLPNFSAYIRHLKHVDHEAQRQYWCSYLEDCPLPGFPVLTTTLSAYTPQPDASIQKTLCLPLTSSSTVTPATVIRAGWALLLAQYSNTDDVVFGTTLSGRTIDLLHIDRMLGPTICTVPVRARMDGDMSVSSFLHRVQREAAEMTPFEQIGLQNIHRLGPQLRAACNFQTHLIIQSGEAEEPPNLLGTPARVDDWEASASYAINLEVTVTGSDVSCDVFYDPRVVQEEQMDLLLVHFGRLLEQLCTQGDDMRLRDLEIITPLETDRIFQKNRSLPDPVDACTHDMIREQSQKHPDHEAVCSWDGNLTYGELEEWSNAVAKQLVLDGTTSPGDVIPIMTEKSLWAMVAMLAVWKAGCAWTLLDTSHPDAWIKQIVEDGNSRVVVCTEACVDRLPEQVKKFIMSRKMVDECPDPAEVASWTRSSPRSVAFILYTSGSTGKPKAIPHEHMAYLSGVAARLPVIKRDQASRVLQFSSYAFDTAIEDSITTFLVGGTVCIPSEHERHNDLVGYMNHMRVSHADFTPSFASIMSTEHPPSLRVLTLSGETVTSAHRDTWAHRVTLINSYGPSEVAIISHTGVIGPSSLPSNVGARTGCLDWIVRPDGSDRLQALGCVGELLLEGPILSRGYLNNEVKTRESFITNPSWLPASQFGPRRLYRTGDLARYTADGGVQIIGRKDDSMRKLRGQRIEVSQVESYIVESLAGLHRDDGGQGVGVTDVLADVVNLAQADGGDGDGGGNRAAQSLVVFVSLGDAYSEATDQKLATWCAAIDHHLCNSLPSYMVPTAIVPLERFPLTVHGKTDKKELVRLVEQPGLPTRICYIASSSGHMQAAQAGALVAVSTLAEKRLRDLWAETLGIAPDCLGADSNFVHLGGDSIMAMKMVALANRKGEPGFLTVESVLRNPVLSDMARRAMDSASSEMRSGSNADEGPVAPFQLLNVPTDRLASTVERLASMCEDCGPDAVEDVYPCTRLQQGLMALSTKRPGTYVSQQVFELPAWVEADRFKEAWDTVHASTAILRTRIVQSSAEDALQVVVKEGRIDWAEGCDVDEYLRQDMERPMGQGSRLSRYALLENRGTCHFIWTMHHAIYDGWCISLLLTSVSQAYNGAFVRPRAEYSQFVRHLIQKTDQDDNPRFWRQYLDGVTEAAIFPRLPSPAHNVRADASLDYTMSLPAGYRSLGSANVNLTTLLHTAWGMLVSKYLESADFVFGTTKTGRGAPVAGIDEIAGPTFATVPFRMSIEDTVPVAELLCRVQTQFIEMLAYEHFGLHGIKAVSDDAARASSFQTLVVVQPKEEADPGMFANAHVSGDISDFNHYCVMLQLKPCSSHTTVGVNVSFDSAVVDVAQMQRILHQLEHLVHELCRLAHDQAATLADINYLTRQDHAEILAWNNNGVAPEADNRCIHDVITQQAEQHPDEPAICLWDGHARSDMSYRELDSLSSLLGRDLIRRGVRPESIVPICSEKSFFAVVALLAVLKAGGAYVLLDPAHPLDRLLSVIQQTRAKIMIASEICARLFTTVKEEEEEGSGLGPDILSERGWLESASNSDIDTDNSSTAHNSTTQASPSNLACLVFTSGSTGRPKGIQLQHSAVCTSVLRGHGPALNLTRASRVFQFASFAFDMALYDICGTLMMGGCVCMPTEASRLNGLAASIRALDANWAFFTPSTVTLLSPDEVPCLRDLTVGGEAVKQETVDVWAGRVNLFQCSGPAETTTCVTQAMQPTTSRSRLGKGAGVLCWVVSTYDYNVLAPIGTVGELIIEGATVARGYLADEHNALGLFIPTPTWAKLAASDADLGVERRFYRCGDLVRYDSEGGLNFVGRKDTQIKVRGQRIELAEVEECIKEETRSDVVAEVIVPLSRGDSESERSAMLVVLISIGQEGTAAESLTSSPSSPSPPPTTCSVISRPPDVFYAEISRLQARATACLPPYMIPSFYVPVSCIPLNSSGKVDRKMLKTLGSQLSAKDLALFSSPEQRVVPVETPAERLMQELWAQVLKAEADTIGANSNLLHMGGDSISAMQLVALATDRGLSLTVADIFRSPELRNLCRSVSLLDVPGPQDAQHQPFDLLRSSASADGGDNCNNVEDDTKVRHEIAKLLGINEDAIEDAYPCTPLQEGLMLSSVQSDGGAFIAREVYALPSDVDMERFKMACEVVYQSHSVLRSCIAQSESLGCINVVLRGPLHWHHGDDIDDYLQKDGRNPIRFGDVLTRWAIVGPGTSSSSAEVFFAWTRHHSAYDGYSLQAALEDIQAAYNAKTTMLVTPEPKTSFRDFVQYLAGQDTAANIAYWERALGPTTQPAAVWRSPNQALTPETVETAELQVPLPPLTGSNITVSTCIRAAWALMLQRYSGSDSIIFGETLSGRNVPVPGVDRCPGPTFTTVPVCIAVDRDLAAASFLQEIQDQFVEMIPHQHYGLQNIMKINANLREACHYDSLLIIQPQAVEYDDDSFLRPVRLGGDSSFFTNALTLICHTSAEGIQASLHYDKSQLGKKQAPRLLAQFAHVLQQLASKACSLGPAIPLSEIEYMSLSDLSEVMQWNQNPPPPTVIEDCVHDVITRTANKCPDAVAIDAWDGTYTYADLDRTSSCLAEHLVQLGVSTGTLVPLIFPKSCWFIISIVAVLKAGGAFVGISHEDPQERIDSIISSCAPSLVLVSPECAHLAAPTGATALVVTKDLVASLAKERERSAGGEPMCRSTAVGPSDLSCVVFTSGSTGVPKGIMLEHSLVCTNSMVHAPAISISASTRALHFSNHCWDALFIEVMYPLMHGGCVCVPPDQARMNSLAGVLNATRANWVFATPTTASLVSPEDVPGLETLVMGGEAASEHVLATWQAFRGNVHNIYGPAECGVFVVTNRNHKQSTRPSELGRRITGRLWLCDPDDHNRLAPIGCVGELLVEGPVLARGYLNQPEKTAESFLETTSWLERVGRAPGDKSVARLYRTGDLLRYGDDGTFEFVGRRDFQFKINGQRVDAADVEQHIIAHLGTAGGAVVVDKVSLPGAAAKAVLAAFIDVSGGSGGEKAAREYKDLRRNLEMDEDLRQRFNHLQEALAAELPRFMVPTLYVPMGGMPLTATGKLDRKALWALCGELQGSQLDSYRLLCQEKEPPVGAAEVRLQRLWSRVLDTTAESIGRHDSFLNLGGDSIAAMRLVTLARREGLSLDVASVFHKPKLLDMAMTLDSSKQASSGEARVAPYKPFSLVKGDYVSTKSRIASLIPYRTTNIADIYPATNFQALSVASGLLQCRGMWGYFSFDGVGELDLDRLKESCSRLVQAHEVLRTVFVRDGGNLLQVVLDRINFRFEVFQTGQPDLAVQSRRVISQDMSRPIRLADTFVAFFLVQSRSSNLFRLTVRMNHAQYDSLSLPGLWKTLADAYRQEVSPIPTPPSPTAYSLYMREYAAQRSDPRSRTYWCNLLRGATMTQLTTRSSPRYRPCSSSNAVTTAAHHATIHTTGLVGSITPATVVKAAWAIVLRELMPSQPNAADEDNDIVFLTTVSGRATSTSSSRNGEVVGACLSVVPVRVHLDNNSACTGASLTRRIQDQNTAGLESGLPGLDAMLDQGSASPDGSGGTSLGWAYQGGSLVQHDSDISDSVTAEEANGSGGISLGEAVLQTAESMGNPGDFADVAIHSSLAPYAADEGVIGFPSTRKLLVQVTALAPEIDGALAAHMAERICFHAEHLTAHPDEPVWHRIGSGLTAQEEAKWRLPLLEAPLPPPGSANPPPPGQRRTSSSGGSPSPPLTPTEQNEHLAKMLEDMWVEVLGGAGVAGASAAVDLGRSFFDQGGDVVKVCCLADALRVEGYDVSMEALIYRQYFYEQLSLLSVM